MTTKDTRILHKLIKDALAFLADNDGPALAPSVARSGQKALDALFRRTEATTLDAAIALAESKDSRRRRLGATILGNLGEWSCNPGGVFKEERSQALKELLQIELGSAADPGVLADVCAAFGPSKTAARLRSSCPLSTIPLPVFASVSRWRFQLMKIRQR